MSASAAQTHAALIGTRRAPTRAHSRAGWAPERTSAGRAAPSSAGPTRGRVAAAAGRASAPRAFRESSLPRASSDATRGASFRARARRDVSARVSAAAPGSASARFTGVFPLDSAGVGWDPVELHALTGLAWTFTTPSSTDGRKIVKAASVIADVSLKGSSAWRKEDWEAAARRADVRLLDTFSTLPGMRGFRACWAPNGVALLYVPGWRKFFSVNDVKAGVADAKAEKAPGGVDAALAALCRVKKGFEEQYLVACDAEAAARAAPRAAQDAADRAAGVLAARSAGKGDARKEGDAGGSPGGGAPDGKASSAAAEAEAARALREREALASAYDAPRSALARWCLGLGVDAAQMHAEFGLGYDFHGPAGAVSRSVVAAAAARAGDAAAVEEAETDGWAKAEWVDAMERYGIVTRASHASLTALGRSWKVCWVADALELGTPAVFLWVPERNAYYTLGALAAAAGSAFAQSREGGAPVAVEAAIRAVVGVAKSTPAPPGLKAALTRDCDFLTLLGRKPADANAPVSAGTTGGAEAARAADARFAEEENDTDSATASRDAARVPRNADTAEAVAEASDFGETIGAFSSETAADDDARDDAAAGRSEAESDAADDADDDADDAAEASSSDFRRAAADDADDADDADAYFRPAPELDDFEWADSRDGLRRRPSREDDGAFEPSRDLVNPTAFVDEPMSAPGFEDVPGMEGFLPSDAGDVTGQGEFFSRSAGYLSFVDGSWSKEDLAREMGLDRQSPNDPPVTPRDFPDLSEATRTRRLEYGDAGAEETSLETADDSDSDDFKELVPLGLPKDFNSYKPLRLHGCDYLVTITNDGRLDLRDAMVAFRREDGNFAGEARRVDASAILSVPPGYYHEVAWTERELKQQEKHVSRDGPTEYNTLVERTTKVYLVAADAPLDEAHAFDRRLDFSRPVVVLDNQGACSVAEVRGARENPGGVLVIREGELFVESAESLPDWETVCLQWEQDAAARSKEGRGPALHEDFLKETEDDYVPDDTPEIDTY